jgi:phosphoribosylcarboxyaminoimidazole (NCAIR) mutase
MWRDPSNHVRQGVNGAASAVPVPAGLSVAVLGVTANAYNADETRARILADVARMSGSG